MLILSKFNRSVVTKPVSTIYYYHASRGAYSANGVKNDCKNASDDFAQRGKVLICRIPLY